MFYIDRRAAGRKKDVWLLRVLPTAVVFAGFFIATLLSYASTLESRRVEQAASLDRFNTEMNTMLARRIRAYEDLLRGAAGLFYAGDAVTAAGWRDYLSPFEMETRFPSIEGVGYVTATSDEGEIQSTAIRYIAPDSANNAKLIGYDVYSELERRSAMNTARDTGQAALSTVATSASGSKTGAQALMYVPLYTNGSNPQTVADRREALAGFVYISFLPEDFIRTNIQPQRPGYVVAELYDTAAGQRTPLYRSDNLEEVISNEDILRQTTVIEVGNTRWELLGTMAAQDIGSVQRPRPIAVLSVGILFSFVVAGFLYMLLANRAQALTDREAKTIESAKDELLALASHQLRTPATGVKQYIGMLKEGLVGKLTPMQEEIVDKAYESNERQLTTINEMLFVARIDAGQMNLRKRRFDMRAMVVDIVEEQASSIELQHQRCTLRLPNKPVYYHGDKQFIRMAFENILSNASKYTKPGGKIDVELSVSRKQLKFRVTDNGVGVSEADKHLLFQKFSRIPNELTGKVSGTGIGLYLAKKIVDAHSGKLQFDSQPHKGSAVTISLPYLAFRPN